MQSFYLVFFPEEAKARTNELLEVIEMTDFANAKVKTLSGGQQQRVAIARALAKEPELLLLDEPFSQIDNFKKNSLRRSLFNYLKEKNIGCIIATHDGTDALSFADKLIVIQHQKVIAEGKPITIYKHPKLKYVASLFDDVNDFYLAKKAVLRYPHQIQIVEHSEIKAIVKQCYFKGNYWLIEVVFENQTLFLNHSIKLEVERSVSLAIDTIL